MKGMDNLSERIENICLTMSKITDDINKKRINSPGTMNIAEIMNRHHLENQHSNVLAFLLAPNEKHHHEEYGEKFLSMLQAKDLKLKSLKICSVHREDETDELRRMDLFVETENDYIIIENKIYAGDQYQQIQDYIQFVEDTYSAHDNVFVVYITLFGVDPTEKSISKKELEKLKKEHRYTSISYEKDILLWLESLETRDEELELKSGIIQYTDVVKGVTNQRTGEFDMNKEIAKNLFNKYGTLSREELREKMRAIHDFENNISLTLFVNFFEDAYKESNGQLQLICKNKSDYKDISSWKKDVLQEQEYFGVRLVSNNVTRDLFVRDLYSNEFIYAFISNTNNLKWKDVDMPKSKRSDFGIDINETGYDLALKLASWFSNALFDTSGWENSKTGKLSQHVVRNWFELE